MSEPLLESRFVRETGAAAGIAALAGPVLEGLGFRLVLARILQGQGTIVEIMAERPDGTMSIDDCRTVSLALSPVLDVHDPVSGSYRLQISSPGIDRPLVRPADFDRWAGFEARIELKEMIDGRKRFRGILEGFEDGEVRIEVDLGKDQGVKVLGLPLALVGEAKLMLTDELVRESLRRTKQELARRAAETGAQETDTLDGETGAGETGPGAIEGTNSDASADTAPRKSRGERPERRRPSKKRRADRTESN